MDPKRLDAEARPDMATKEVGRQEQDYELKERNPKKDYFDSLDLKLSDEQELAIVRDIKDIITAQEAKMAKWVEEWKEARKWYEDELEVKTVPWEGCSQHHEPIIENVVDAIRVRAKRAIFGKRPIWVFEPREKTDIESCKRKEDFIDYEASVEMDLEGKTDNTLHEAILLGNGFLALSWINEVKRVRDIEAYNGTNDLDKFIANYPDAEETYPEYLARIKNGERVELFVSYDDEVYNAPKPEYVKAEDIIADVDIPEADRQICLGRWKYFTRNELLALEKKGFFKDVSRLWSEEKSGENKDNPKPDTKLYAIAEVIYKCDLDDDVDDDVDDDGLAEDNLFWVAKDGDYCFRSIAYPYWHMRPFIIPFYAEAKGDKFFRRGYGYRMKRINGTVDALIQQAVDTNSVAGVPAFTTDDPDFNPANWPFYPGCTMPKGLEQLKITSTGQIGATMELAQWIKKGAEEKSGVTNYMTGRESATDPTAPAAKTTALLFEANLRISECIRSLQKSMQEVGFQIAQLYYQFIDQEKEYRILGKPVGEPAFAKLTREDVRIRGDFVPQGTMETINPDLMFQKNKFLYEAGIKNSAIAGNPVIMHELWRNMVMSSGEYWEKIVDKIAPDPIQALEEMQKLQLKIQEKMEELKRDKYKRYLELKGKTPEEIEIMKKGMYGPEPVEPIEEGSGDVQFNPENAAMAGSQAESPAISEQV